MAKKDKKKPLSTKNIKRIAHLDIPGGGQVEVHGKYCYVGHMDPPHGTSIIDISNPKKPKVVATLTTPPNSHSHKVRVIGDLMYTNVEMFNRHRRRLGEQKIPGIVRAFKKKHGREPKNGELAKELGVDKNLIPDILGYMKTGYDGGGWRVFDIKDKTNPKELAYVKTHGFGTHRFHCDEKYAYISTEMEGYLGNILVVYDMKNPAKPKEVSRWWMPGQHIAGGEKPTWKGYNNRLHHAMRVGDELWAAVWHGGFQVLDAKNIKNIKTIGAINYHPPAPMTSHTIMPLEKKINGRRIAVGIDEEHTHHVGQPHACMWVFDVTDLKNIQTLSSYHVSELDSPWSRLGRFGAHQYREKLNSTLVYNAWFSGGLRIVDVADPHLPKEVGYFIPEPVNGHKSPQSNDVDVVDKNGLVYLLDRLTGLDILEFNGA